MMKNRGLQFFSWLLSLVLLSMQVISVSATEAMNTALPISEAVSNDVPSELFVAEGSLELPCKSAVLMEAETGTILYQQNAEEALPPASVTKIMTLLLVMEAIDAGTVRLDDMVTTSANAASMGGSQVYLKEGERMSVEDMLKSVIIASANDAAVALAEHIAGSASVFVEKMNARAAALGMKNTSFENVTGLDDTAERHLTDAHDIAVMSRELIKHETILNYSSIWMDTIRNGEFGLTNTNRLVRFYPGCTGLKTGSTSKAGFCVSVTAERDGTSLICVIMGAESRDIRNATATQLLDWGFANYGVYRLEAGNPSPVVVKGGTRGNCRVSYGATSVVLPKDRLSSVEVQYQLPNDLKAPVKKGDEIGSVLLVTNETTVATLPIVADEDVERIGLFEILQRMWSAFALI